MRLLDAILSTVERAVDYGSQRGEEKAIEAAGEEDQPDWLPGPIQPAGRDLIDEKHGGQAEPGDPLVIRTVAAAEAALAQVEEGGGRGGQEWGGEERQRDCGSHGIGVLR